MIRPTASDNSVATRASRGKDINNFIIMFCL